MGETTMRTRATTEAMKDARDVLARTVMQPRMDAIAALAVAADTAANPDQVRQAAHQRADELAEQARQRGRELVDAARQKAKHLQKDAARRRKELLARAEADIQEGFTQWQAAYKAAVVAGWTTEQLQEVGHQPPPRRPPRRASRRRAPAATNSNAGTSDAAHPAERRNHRQQHRQPGRPDQPLVSASVEPAESPTHKDHQG
jgi:hypothetical protein